MTLLFELAPDEVYGDWFLLDTIVYPNDTEQWGSMAGKGMSLQHYLNGLGNHIFICCICWFVYINAKEKEMWFVISVLFTLSAINYICNNHKPFIANTVIDMNYVIATYLCFLIYYKWKDLLS